jgi:predicted transcriptional regulator
MLLQEIKDVLEAEVFCGEEYLKRDAQSACGSDLMSDVLAFGQEQSVLLTGLLNPQVIRTAEMMDICCVVFVRGKAPDEQMIKLAQEKEIVLMSTQNHMYSACGKLYCGGLMNSAG